MHFIKKWRLGAYFLVCVGRIQQVFFVAQPSPNKVTVQQHIY